MIPSSIVTSFIIALAMTTIVPIALLIVLGVKRKTSALPLLVGFLAFFISQIILRMPILNTLSTFEWYNSFQSYSIVLFILFLCFTAGLFEESARLGGAMLLKQQKRFKDAVSFGLGHGICEVIILVGLTNINNVIYCIAVNSPDVAFASTISTDVLEAVAAFLIDINPAHIYLGILERVFAVVIHVSLTVMVFYSIVKKKRLFFVLAIAAHTLVNFITLTVASYLNLIVAQLALLIMTTALGLLVLRVRTNFDDGLEPDEE